MDDNAASSAVADRAGSNGGTLLTAADAEKNTSTISTTGVSGGALEFASADYVDCGTAAGLLPANMTVSLWLKSTTENENGLALGWSEYYALGTLYNSGSHLIGFYRNLYPDAVNGENYCEFDADGVRDGDWHHVALYCPNTTTQASLSGAQCWLDGVALTRSTTVVTRACQAFSRFTIGDTESGGLVPFNGCIEDVTLYAKQLQTYQVKWLYNRGKSRYKF